MSSPEEPFPVAEMESAVDERIDHRVGHAEEEDPGDVSCIYVVRINESVDDEDDLVGRPANYEGCNDERCQTQRANLRPTKQQIPDESLGGHPLVYVK